MADCLPDFVIIGATKAATTWLLQNLKAHPQIFMPDPELHYFSRHFERGEAWYREQFRAAPQGAVIGEKSASYLPHPEVPRRLKALLPDARLIAQLRNPIERAYSDYCMHFRRGQVGRDPARYLNTRRSPIPRLLEDGLYFRHISAFLEVFSRDQLKIVLFDDLRREPGPVFREVCAHIGVEARADAELLHQKVKDRTTPVVPPLAKRALAPLKGAVRPFRETTPFRFARSLIARELDYPELPPLIWDQLRDFYLEDVEQLEKFLDRDLGAWLLRPEPASAAS